MNDNVIIRTENLMKTYGADGTFVHACERINIAIAERQLTAIVGPSGSGKSTLLHLLGGIDNPSGGAVYVYESTNGENGAKDAKPVNLYSLSRNKLAKFRGKNFGFVFQNYALLPVLTAWENVMIPSIYSNAEFDKKYAQSLFEKLGLQDRIDHLPSELSGGEQQRVAVIRALVSHPRILFADEPTGNLDRKNGTELTEILLKIRDEEKRTIVMVTHDMSIAEIADRVITLEDGHVVRVHDRAHTTT